MHAGSGPPQFSDDASRINSKSARTPGPARWSPANEPHFFHDIFQRMTLTALSDPRQAAHRPELLAALNHPRRPPYFLFHLWEAMYQQRLITMFAAPGTASFHFKVYISFGCAHIYVCDPPVLCLRGFVCFFYVCVYHI